MPWLTGPHPKVRQRIERYRSLLTEHGHEQKRMTFIFWLLVDPDHNVAIREGREAVRAYTNLFTSFVPPELMNRMKDDDPFKAFLQFIRAMPDQLEERAVVGTPAECRRRLAELNDEFGLDQVAFYFHAGGQDIPRVKRRLELFAREVMPEFR